MSIIIQEYSQVEADFDFEKYVFQMTVSKFNYSYFPKTVFALGILGKVDGMYNI